MTVLSWTQSLLLAGAEGVSIAVLALLLFRAHRRVGIIPFIAFVSLLAAAVPSVIHQSVLDGGPLDALPRVQATAAPVLIALVVLLHLTRGWRNAQLTASTALVVTLFVSAVAALGPIVELGVGQPMLPSDPLVPLAAGLLLWLGAMSASVALIGVYRAWKRCPPLPAVVGATLLGLTVQGAGVIGLARGGLVIPGTTGFGPLTLPIVVGAAPTLLVALYATVQLSGVWPETRMALISRDPIGSESQLDDALDLQDRYKEARAVERQEADTYKQLVESGEHGAYVCTPEGRITYANKALARILEQPDRDLAGENIQHVLGGTDARGRPQFRPFPVQAGTHRATVQLPNGHERSIEVTVKPTGEGTLYGRVRDRTTEVLRARLERQKDRAEFYVDLLRHDIGNYVMTPMNYLSMLKRHEDLPEDARSHIERSHAAVEDIADLLRRIDVLSDVDELRPEPVDAAEILASVAGRFERKHPELTLERELPDRPVAVAGSPLLDEVFVNLVGNAIRHAGEDARITVGAEPDGTQWILSVADDGPGVPDETKASIFDRTHHDESAGGKGLGLYIVQTITAALGGEVWVEDRVPGSPGEGARFNVRLPAVSPERLDDGSVDPKTSNASARAG